VLHFLSRCGKAQYFAVAPRDLSGNGSTLRLQRRGKGSIPLGSIIIVSEGRASGHEGQGSELAFVAEKLGATIMFTDR
jgi:hypothetical protein